METDGKGSSFGPFISALSKNSLKGRYIGLLDISQKKKKKKKKKTPIQLFAYFVMKSVIDSNQSLETRSRQQTYNMR
jgi:hypothetical protein